MKKTILAILTLLTCLAAPLPAEIMTYQGRLKDNSLPANGNYAFAFDFCDAAQTACFASTDNPQNFLVANGLFKSTFTMPSVDLSAQAWYLRVSVGGSVLSPIERLTFVPYSVYASSAGYAPSAVQKAGDVMSGQLTLAGSTLTVTGNEFSVGVTTFVVKNGYVGIGTASPSNPLQVSAVGQYVFSANSASTYATLNLVPSGGGTARLNNNGAPGSKVALSVGHVDQLVVTDSGNVGISSTTPAYRLSVSSGAGEGGDMVVISTGDSNVIRLTGGGEVYATRFIGDGSAITGVTGAQGTDASKLPLAGGTLTGNLLIHDSTLSVTGGGISVSSSGAADVGIYANIGGGHIWTNSGHPLYLGAGGINRMVVDVSGNIGVNKTGPLYHLDVAGAGAFSDQIIAGGTLTVQGNAFSVGESTFVVNGGRVAIGADVTETSAAFSVVGNVVPIFRRYTVTPTAGGHLNLQKSNSATIGSNVILNDGDVVGQLSFQAANGASYSQAAYITGTIDGTPGPTADMPGALNFWTSPDGTATPTQKLIIKNDGNVGIGTTIPQARLDVKAAGATPADMAQIWTDSAGVIVSSVSATGSLQAVRFVGDGSGLTGISADLTSPMGTLAVAYGGTGAVTPAGARSNLGALASFGDIMTGPLEIHVGADPAAFRVGVSTFVVMDGKVGVNTSAPIEALEVGAGNLRLPLGQRLEWGGAPDSITGSLAGMVIYQANSPRLGISSNGGYTTVGAGDVFSVAIDTNSALHVVANGLSSGDGRLAVFGDLRSSGSVAGQYLAAGNFEATVDGPDSAEAAIGLRAKIRRENVGGGTINNAYGIMVDDIQNDAGVIGKTYGLYIGDQTSGTQTDPAYSLYAADSNARSYFAGTVGIGAPAPAYALDVFGDVGVSGNVFASASMGVGTMSPAARLDVKTPGSAHTDMAQIWRNSAGAIVSSMSATGYIQAVKFIGDGSGLTNVAAATGVDNTKLPLAGGTMTGPLTLSINNPTPASPVVLAEDTSAIGEPQFEVRTNGYRGRMSIAGTNGGMYFGSLTPNFLSFQTAGAEWMRLTTQGYLGIGTASPQHYLHISSNTSSPSNTLLKLSDTGTGAPQLLLEAGGHQGRMATAASNGGTYIGTLTNDFLVFQTNSAEQMRIATDGKIGTGGILPAEAFDVASRVQISTFAGNVDTDGFYSFGINGIKFTNGGNTYLRVAGGGNYVGMGGPSVFSNTNSPKLQVQGSMSVGSAYNATTPPPNSLVVENRVGIGASSPGGLLDIRDNAAVSPYLMQAGTGPSGGYFTIYSSGVVGVGYGYPSTNTVLHAQAIATNVTAGEDVTAGLIGSARAAGTAGNDVAVGGDFRAEADGNQNLGFLAGLHTEVERTSAGTGVIDTAVGLYVDKPGNVAGAGGFTNTYGIYIDTQASGPQTNAPYALYSIDMAARAYFAGKVGIGTASPRYALEVSSAAGSAEQILAVSTGTDANNILFGVKGNGEVYGAYFIGNGAGLTNVSAVDASKLPLAGGTLIGDLTLNSSSLTINSSLGQNFMRLNSDSTFGGVQFASFGTQLGNIGFGNSGGHFIPALPQSMAVQAENGLHLGVGSAPLITMTPANKVGIGVILSPQYSLDVSTANDTDGYIARFGSNGILISTAGALQTTGVGNGSVVGNTRGNGAVDMQTYRDVGTQVASGPFSVISGGIRNSATYHAASVGGGQTNAAVNFYATVGGGNTNTANGHTSVVAGGAGNTASGTYSAVAGGYTNKSLAANSFAGGGQYNVASGSNSAIAGGSYNTVTGTSAVVAGGEQNSASAMYAGVLGGNYNRATNPWATVAGGYDNEASNMYAYAGGGRMNRAQGDHSTVGGGFANTIQTSGVGNVIPGGAQNAIYSGNFDSAIGGGELNTVYGNGAYGVIAGGLQNYIYDYGWYSVVTGGSNNRIGAYSHGSSIGGGGYNRIYGSSSTIAGGGNNVVSSTFSFIGGGYSNSAGHNYSAIGGGMNNIVTNSADYAFLGGGYQNTVNGVHSALAGGWFNVANGMESFIGAGAYNTADNQHSVITGGLENKVIYDAYAGFIGGGAHNISTAPYSVVAGGLYNTSSGTYSGVLSGTRNEAVGVASFVGGGTGNRANGENSSVGGGWSNTASETGTTVAGGVSNTANEVYSFVGGGYQNDAATGYTAIAGGYQNTIGTPGGDGAYSFIGGGYGNETQIDMSVIGGGETNYIANAGRYGVISGGYANIIRDTRGAILGGEANLSTAPYATVGGGLSNTSSGTYSAVLGGHANEAAAIGAAIAGGEGNYAGGIFSFVGGGRNNSAPGLFSAIGGGENNNTDWGQYAAIGGGRNNFAFGYYSAIPGGADNYAGGQYSLAAGRLSTTTLAAGGSFAWNDNYGDSLINQLPNTVMFKASGGFWVSTGTIFSTPGLMVNNNNDVGMGTAAPAKDLHIKRQNVVPDIRLQRGLGGETWDIGGNGTVYFNVSQAGTNHLTIADVSGKVGVAHTPGTNSAKLQVNGDVGLGDGTDLGNQPVVVWLRNSMGAAVPVGSIVVLAANNAFGTTTTAGAANAIGVVYEPAGIASSAVGRVAIAGVVSTRCNATAAIGNHVTTSGVAGEAASTGFPTSGTSIGIWMEACTSPALGRVLLR